MAYGLRSLIPFGLKELGKHDSHPVNDAISVDGFKPKNLRSAKRHILHSFH